MNFASTASLAQILLMCRPGFEKECAGEIMQYASAEDFPAYIKTENGNGYVHLVSSENTEATVLLERIDFSELIFTRQWFACTAQIKSLTENNRVKPLTTIATQIAKHRHGRFNGIELSYPDTNQGKALSRFCRSFRPHLVSALKREQLLSANAQTRLHVFFTDSTHAWPGISPVANSAADAMGIARLRMPATAPSRSTLKLEEAIHWFLSGDRHHRWFKPGMHAVDLGASPGGWTWQLVKRGLLVTAVDNGPMDQALMDSGIVEHLRTDAFTYSPPDKVQWLVCDMAERPLHVCRLVARWFVQKYCDAAIFNLKLPMKKRYQTLLDCKQLLQHSLDNAGIKHRLQMKQLYHDREEVTACLIAGDDAINN